MLDIHKQGSKFSFSVSLWWIQHAFIVSFSFIFLSSVPFFVVYAYNVLCTIRRVLARTKWRIYNAVGQAVMTGGAFRKRERAEFMERSKRKEKNKREQQKWILHALEYGRSSVQNMILTLFLPISMVCLSYFPFGIDSMMASDFPAFFRSLVRNFEFAEQLSKKSKTKKNFVAYLWTLNFLRVYFGCNLFIVGFCLWMWWDGMHKCRFLHLNIVASVNCTFWSASV